MNATLRLRQLAPLLAALHVPASMLAGQTVSARAVIAAPRSSVSVGGVMDRVDGLWGGMALGFRAGRFSLSGSGTASTGAGGAGGSLTGGTTTLLPLSTGTLTAIDPSQHA